MANEPVVRNESHVVSAEEREKVRAARREEHEKRKEQLDRDRDEMIQRNEEKIARESKYKPTPTPDELNAARAGVNVDHKEHDGSPYQDIHASPADVARGVDQRDERQRRSAEAEGRAAGYKTRDTQAHQPVVDNKKAEENKKT